MIIKLFPSKEELLKHQELFFIMSTFIDEDVMFENACDDIPDDLFAESFDVVEALDLCFDFPVQTAITTPAYTSVDALEQPQQTVARQPRMVSMDDMTPIRKATIKKENNLTPYDSLRLLVKNKRKGVKRSTEGRTLIEDDFKPYSFLRASLSNKQTQPALKLRKVNDPSLLHRACSNRNLSFESIQGILREDPGAASRQHTLFTEEKVYNYLSHYIEIKRVRESYTYPLNMALEKDANIAVVKSLIDADKDVLGRKDGLEQEGSLHIFLKHQRNNTNALDAILSANPSSLLVEDRHFNTPLHIACRSGASMNVIRHLWHLYPEALSKRNFHGLTPLDVARNNGHMCSDEVAFFLCQKVKETN
jgi:hypothetical protein